MHICEDVKTKNHMDGKENLNLDILGILDAK